MVKDKGSTYDHFSIDFLLHFLLTAAQLTVSGLCPCARLYGNIHSDSHSKSHPQDAEQDLERFARQDSSGHSNAHYK